MILIIHKQISNFQSIVFFYIWNHYSWKIGHIEFFLRLIFSNIMNVLSSDVNSFMSGNTCSGKYVYPVTFFSGVCPGKISSPYHHKKKIFHIFKLNQRTLCVSCWKFNLMSLFQMTGGVKVFQRRFMENGIPGYYTWDFHFLFLLPWWFFAVIVVKKFEFFHEKT